MFPQNEYKEDCDAKPPTTIGLTWPKVISAFVIPLEIVNILTITTYGTPTFYCWFINPFFPSDDSSCCGEDGDINASRFSF